MKRLSITVTANFLVEDVTTEQDVILEAVRTLPNLEAVSFGRTLVSDVRTGTCKVGPHPFVVDHWFSPNKPVPDVCRNHWYELEVQEAGDEHAPFFAEVERLTGLKGHIWQSGGMTMTIVVPTGDTEFPTYMGLKEGQDDDGRWLGSLSYYATAEESEDGEGTDLLPYPYEPMTPQQWAQRLAEHHNTV